MRRATWARRGALVTLAGFVALNALAYGHARTMTHFSADGTRTGKAETLSWGQKLGNRERWVRLVHSFLSRFPGPDHKSKGAAE